MASDDNPLQPLINRSTTTDSSNLRYTNSVPSTTIINMIPDSTLFKKERASPGVKKIRQHSTKEHSSVKEEKTMMNLTRRLAIRKVLQIRLSLITDIMCGLALLGIILMIIENEIKFAQINNQETVASWALKLIITISTIILVILVFVYHRFDLGLYAVNNVVGDWRIGLTNKKIILIILEAAVCMIHPFVPAYPKNPTDTNEQLNSNITLMTPTNVRVVRPEIILSLIMFLRVYLFCRFAIYHSKLSHNVGLQSLGYLNQVSIDFLFLCKSNFTKWPTRSLSIFLVITWLICSWAVRACEYDSSGVHKPILDAMWFFIVTFTTVGYGDIVPYSYCGRGLATVIAFIGLLGSALLIAIVSQKLVFDRGENYVHEYVSNMELVREHKTHAANIIKFCVKQWTLARNTNLLSRMKSFQLKRKTFQAVNAIQMIKKEQRGLENNFGGLSELAISQHNIVTTTEDTKKTVAKLKEKMNNFEKQLSDVKESIDSMQNTLKLLVEISNKS